VYVLDIDPTKKQAIVQFRAWIQGFPFEVEEVKMVIWGGYVGLYGEIDCRPTPEFSTSPYDLHGWSQTVEWLLRGNGEAYPFDSYILNFTISPGFEWKRQDSWGRFPLSYHLCISAVVLYGSQQYVLRNIWETLEGKGYNLPVEIETSNGCTVRVQRLSIMPFCQTLLPILACYFFLGGSMFVASSKLDSRLRIYLPLFLFSPAFFLSIQTFLPYRSSLSIPEFLLTNLIISTATFGLFSMISSSISSVKISTLMDILAAVLSVIISLWLFQIFLAEKSNVYAALTILVVEIAYTAKWVICGISIGIRKVGRILLSIRALFYFKS
jgi:hypothetical protein